MGRALGRGHALRPVAQRLRSRCVLRVRAAGGWGQELCPSLGPHPTGTPQGFGGSQRHQGHHHLRLEPCPVGTWGRRCSGDRSAAEVTAPGPRTDFQPGRSRRSTAERQPKAVLTVGSRLDGPLPEPQVFRLGHLRGCSGCQHGAWRAPQAPQRWALCAGPPTGCPTSKVGTQPGGGVAGWVGGAAPGSSHSRTMPHRARAAWPSLGPYRHQSPPSSHSSHSSHCRGQWWGRIPLEVPTGGGKRDVGSINSVASHGHSGLCRIQQGLESRRGQRGAVTGPVGQPRWL